MAACGGGGGGGGGGSGLNNPGIGGTDGVGGSGSDSSGGGSGGRDILGDGGSDGASCQPTSCETQGKSCGAIADGCGSTIDCGTCGDGEVCGLGAANVCAGIDDVCVRQAQESACQGKECGVVGDGCGGTYLCGSCADTETCGLEAAYQCATNPNGSLTECPGLITSCASVGANCGIIGNGCGGTIDCDQETGGCGPDELCGYDSSAPQTCAVFDVCVPLDPTDACAGTCGKVSNGCGPEVDGGFIDCDALAVGGGCTGGDTCGGGGVPFECGQGGSVSCTADPDACAGRTCGFASDGCGDSVDCSGGTGCGNGTQCVDGTCEAILGCSVIDQPTACAGKECGEVSDNCGGTYDCGSCTGNETCGRVTAFQCDYVPTPGPGCVGLNQAEACAGKECNIAYDGCGTAAANTFNCGPNGGACTGSDVCGAQAAYQCDPMPTPPACTPNGATCASMGWACGVAVGNCGQLIDCADEGRSCPSTQACVGGITGPTTCSAVIGNNGADCPLCAAVPSCSNQVTQLTGRVISPGQADDKTGNQVGVPNAFVYILRGDDTSLLPAIGTGLPGSNGLSCDRCEDQDLGPVLVGDVTDASGNFVLEGNVPVGQQFILVTKVGKFRRAQRMTLPAGAACTTTNLPTTMSTVGETAGQGTDDNPTRLPRSMSDGLAGTVNIPRIAVTTGRIDAMECVFYKMGIAQSEFGNYSAAGTNRIDLYRGASSGTPEGMSINASTPHDAALYGDLSRLEAYDMVVSDCEGGGWDENGTQTGTTGLDATQGGKVRQYVNRGGRMFLSHLSYSWLHYNATTAWSAGAPIATGLKNSGRTWDAPGNYTQSGNLNTSGTGVISLGRTNSSPRIQTFADWIDVESTEINGSATPTPDYSFNITDPRSMNTALATLDEEFVHRSGGNNRTQQFSFNTPYGAPAGEECGRVAYSGFHVAATGGGNNPFQNAVFPTDCDQSALTTQEKILLFMLFDLGTCVGDEPDAPTCTPLTCEPGQCGIVPDGCGDTMDCSTCAAGSACQAGQCVVQCVPTTCEEQGIACSTIADGCGGVIACDCNVCTPDNQATVCAGKCGFQSDGCSDVYNCGTCPSSCTPLAACPAGLDCGVIGDGCNGTLDCGDCTADEACGVFDANVCAPPSCRELTCYDLPNVECGMVSNGCGDVIECGSCSPGQLCTTVGGQPNRCAGCTPKTQQAACTGLECGLVGDGCGGTVDCGTCSVAGEYCGAVSPNMCDPGASCTPQACPAGAQCGVVGDGCGGTVTCGTCPAGQLCGVFEAYKCGGCTPTTCEAAGAQCGQIGDGCGGQLDCGECQGSYICGLGQANKCGQLW